MSDAGSTGSARRKDKQDAKKMVDPAICDIQIKNLDKAVTRLHQQKDGIVKQMTADEKELAWVVDEIKRFEEKKAMITQTRTQHETEHKMIVKTNKESKDKLQNELMAEAKALTAAARKAHSRLIRSEYTNPHKNAGIPRRNAAK
mmetsp:Transcript_22825/g.58500  ORF Transcript_22825/g.58500 Transcript_22825/m.58500 type:complete len:145 (+) Transcript_22825:230-664(+)|eukprot:jgi/Tetstr1/427588/TSEL_017713.t1